MDYLCYTVTNCEKQLCQVTMKKLNSSWLFTDRGVRISLTTYTESLGKLHLTNELHINKDTYIEQKDFSL